MKTAKEHKPQQSRVIQSKNSSYAIQLEPSKRHKGYGTKWSAPKTRNLTLWGENWEACTYREITIPKGILPLEGTPTSGSPPWNGILLDAGYDDLRNATRLHVISSHFGGRGENDLWNLHPGSQQLNKNHEEYAENYLKEILSSQEYDDKTISYACKFDWDNSLQGNNYIKDPLITCTISVEDEFNKMEGHIDVPEGKGMFLNI